MVDFVKKYFISVAASPLVPPIKTGTWQNRGKFNEWRNQGLYEDNLNEMEFLESHIPAVFGIPPLTSLL